MTPSRDMLRLIEIMATLRTPVTGCPWDLEQTFATIAPYTIEEAYEVAEAIAHGDLDDLIPVQALFQAASGLASLGVPVEWHLSKGIGHGIDQEGLRHGGEFLARAFSRPVQPMERNLAGT